MTEIKMREIARLIAHRLAPANDSKKPHSLYLGTDLCPECKQKNSRWERWGIENEVVEVLKQVMKKKAG